MSEDKSQMMEDGKKKEDVEGKRDNAEVTKSPNVCTFNTMNYIAINTVKIELKLQKKTIVKGILGMLSYE